MKVINLLICLLVILDSIGIIYIKYLDTVINKKINEIDQSLYEFMKEDHNGRVKNKEE